MKIALFGATGPIGKQIAQEALSRGHEVTAIVRDPARVPFKDQHLTVKQGDVGNITRATEQVKDHDAIVSAIGPGREGYQQIVLDAAHSLIDITARAKMPRLVVVGGAGSLEVAPGVRLMDAPDFPEGWKGIAKIHCDALDIYRKASNVNWTYISPAALIEPGKRTGKYRTGTDQLLTNEKGDSYISIEDFAVALVDELEKPKFQRQRFTVAN